MALHRGQYVVYRDSDPACVLTRNRLWAAVEGLGLDDVAYMTEGEAYALVRELRDLGTNGLRVLLAATVGIP